MNRADGRALRALYRQTLADLYALLGRRGIDLGLDRVRAVLASLGDPQHRFPAFHVAGTNGKGSVAALLHAVLSRAGYRVGLYTSPHLRDFRERIVVGRRRIPMAEVVELLPRVAAAARRTGADLTFFETVTVTAFLHFARREVDVAVVEVGLGGRLDATNTVRPAVSVITTVGLDHTDRLGSTPAEIAREKAGILAAGVPAVAGRMPAEALAVVRGVAAERGAPLEVLGEDFALRPAQGRFSFHRKGERLRGLRLSLPGAFQQDNAAVALAALRAAAQTVPVGEEALRRGLAEAAWPGRLERVRGAPEVLLDAAHNPDGARALAREVAAMAGGRPVCLVFAVMRDKHWEAMVDALAPVCAGAVVTEVVPERVLAAEKAAARFARSVEAVVVREPAAAFRRAVAAAGPGGLVVVTGSVFLVGALRPLALRAGRAPR